MGLCLVHGRALMGLQAPSVTVEVHMANGLPSFTLVGLADVEVKLVQRLQGFEFACERSLVRQRRPLRRVLAMRLAWCRQTWSAKRLRSPGSAEPATLLAWHRGVSGTAP